MPRSVKARGECGHKSKQIRMRTCAEQKQFKSILIDTVNKKPVRLHMAFPKPFVIARQSMVTIFFFLFLSICQCINDIPQMFDFASAFFFCKP